MTEYGALME